MNCPKCGYQRTAKDDTAIPGYQCPSCGIIYAKYLRHKAGFSPKKPEKTDAKKSQPRFTLVISTQYERIAEKIGLRAIIDKIKIGSIDKQKRIIAAGVVSFLVVVTWSYLSPALFFYNLSKTAVEKDASDLVDFIDFEKLKINVKATVKEMLDKEEKPNGDPMQQAGMALGSMMANSMIDNLISPSGVKAMITPKNKSDELPDIDFYYIGFNKAKIILEHGEISLDRTGLFSWVMVGIKPTN